MFKRFLHSILAASIATTPMSATAADQYYFRYKTQISGTPQTPIDEEQYGVGNDIVAYYVTPTGRAFQKKIPVATQDVVSWVKDSSTGEIPTGLSLDAATGIISGTASLPDSQIVLLYGYDAQNHRIARAEVHFTVFEPVGSEAVVDFYGHTGSYFFGTVSSPEGVDVYSWDVVGDQPLPDGMAMTGSGFEGTPTAAGSYEFMLRGFDYLGREVAFATITFVVEDGPKVEEVVAGSAGVASRSLLATSTTREDFGDQTADKDDGEKFSITPTVKNSLGTITYKLVPATVRPSGLTFSSATGALGGVFDDFGTTASFQIQARDSYDGTTGVSNVFKLTTLPKTLDLSAMPDLVGYVATPFYRKLTSAGIVSGAAWSVVQGALPDGLNLDPSTGELTGTPTIKETQTDIVIAVSGPGMVPAQSSPFKFTVLPEAVTGKTNPLQVRTNQAFSTDGITITAGAANGYSFVGKKLPAGVSVDPNTGVLFSTSGIPTAGTYDQPITVVTPDGDEGPIWQPLTVFNALDIDYGDQTVIRRKFLNVFPSLGDNSIVGTAHYTLLPVNGAVKPDWLKLNPSTGWLYGWPMDKSTGGVVYGPFQVKIADGMSEDTSDPFTVTVQDRPTPKVTINNKGVQRFVNNYYTLLNTTDAVTPLRYEIVTAPANFPSTLRFGGAGYLIGTTDDPVGTVYQGIQVKVIDGETYEGLSDPFDLTVIEPKALSALSGSLNKSFEWSVDAPFTLALPTLSNAYGKITYSFDNPLSGVAITDTVNGTVDGTVATEGTYSLPFQISDETSRAPAKGTLTLEINPPMKVTADATYPANRATPLTLQVPTVTGGTPPFTFASTSTFKLPTGLTYINGVLSGNPRVEGTFPIEVTVSDKTGIRIPVTFSLVVDKPLPIELGYNSTTVLKGHYSYVVPTLSNAIGGLENATWSVSGTLPPGLSFNTTGALAGQFTGVPTTPGVYDNITVTVTDSEGRSQPATISIGVSLAGDAVFSDVTLTHRKGTNFTDTLVPSNVIAPLAFSSDDLLALGLVVNSTTGAVTGSFTDVGTYQGTVSVVDNFQKQATAMVTFNIVGDLTASAGDATFKRYVDSSGPVLTVDQSVGALTYSLASGTLPSGLTVDPSTGAVVGASDESGTFPNIVVAVKDSDGVTVNTNAFTVTVDERDPLALTAPDTYEFRQYTEGSVPVSVANGIGTVAYTISPALPTGIVLGTDGQITGTSDVKVSAASYVLTATDSKGGALGTASKTITVSVRERDALEISGDDVVEFTQYGEAQALFAAVAAIGDVQYSISPSLPAGLDFDTATGTISGVSDDEVASANYVITATDSKGGALGTATKSISLTIKARDALTINGADSVKFIQLSEGSASFHAINAIGAVAYSISPATLPDGLTFDTTTGTISGTATTKQDGADYLITAVDDKGGTLGTATKTVSISVGVRLPLTIVTGAAQAVMLDHPYFLSLSADNVVGTEGVTWSVVSGAAPAGVTFDPATGSFSGTPTAFGTAASITIRATDAFGGLDERTIVFTVLQDGTPITLTGVGGTTRIGQAFDIPVSTIGNVVGNPTWSIDAGSTGISIDPKTGKFSGTPSTTFTLNVTIHVTDVTGREATATVEMKSVPVISVALASSTVDLVFNHDVPATAVATATNAVGAVAWTISGTLPAGVGFSATTGALTGKPLELGTFGPIYVTAADTLPGTTKSASFTIKVTMNDDPLELNVTDFVTKVGYPVQTVTPTYGNNLGPVTFFSTDLGSTGLGISSATGVLSGTALATTDVYVNVSVKDRDTTRVTSKPVHYQVLPNMVVSVPSQVIVSALADMTPVAPTRMYVVGTATWDELDQSVHKLPEGMSFDTATGTLKGNPQEIGTFGPFTVSSVDSLGDRGVSNSFMVKSNPGAIFIGLAAATLPDATKRISTYSYDFKQDLTYAGMDETELTWALGAGSPPGLTLASGVLSGTPTKSGTYTFEVSAAYGGVTAKRNYTLVVKLPDIDLQLATTTLASAKRGVTGKDNSYTFDFKSLATLKNIPAASVAYKIEPFATGESFPTGLVVSSGGVVSGTATSDKGDYAFRVTASFTDGTDENISVTTAYTLTVTDEIVIALNSATMTAPTKRVAYTFDLGTLVDDTALKGVTKSQLSWKWSVDPNRNTATTMSTVPAGLTISGSTVSGTPVNSGTYALILEASYDGRTAQKAVQLVSGLQTIALVLPTTIADGTRGDAYSVNFQTASTITNIPAASVGWTAATPASVGTGEIAGLPAGLTLTAGGLLSGSPTTTGKYTFEVTGAWSDNNATSESITKTQSYTITIAAKTGNYQQLVLGATHACVMQQDGVKCWGGYPANGGSVNRATPAYISGATTGIKALATSMGSSDHACAVTTAGALKCWGNNAYGQLGNGSTTNSSSAVTPISSGVASASVGAYSTCAVLTDGTMKCWGRNNYGQLGNGNKTDSSSPVLVSAATNVKQAAVGGNFMCYLTNAGDAKCVGYNSYGNLGDGTKTANTAFVAVSGVSGASSIVAGNNFACTVASTGATKCWGYNAYGQHGTGTTATAVPTPVTGPTVAQLALGNNGSCGVVGEAAKCWGQGAQGRNGDGTTDDKYSPTQVYGLSTGVAQAATGNTFSCALMTSGGVKCWGNNAALQLGSAVPNPTITPVDVSE